MIKLHFPVQPVAKARPRITRTGHCYTPKKTKDFEDTVRHLASLQMHSNGHKPLTGPLGVRVYFYLKSPKKPKHNLPITKPDLDNLQKSVCDALNGVAWEDDSQICDCDARKRYSSKPSITVFIHEITQ